MSTAKFLSECRHIPPLLWPVQTLGTRSPPLHVNLSIKRAWLQLPLWLLSTSAERKSGDLNAITSEMRATSLILLTAWGTMAGSFTHWLMADLPIQSPLPNMSLTQTNPYRYTHQKAFVKIALVRDYPKHFIPWPVMSLLWNSAFGIYLLT